MTVTIENDRTGKKTEFYYVPSKVTDGIKALLHEAEKSDSAIVSADLESDEYYEKIIKERAEKIDRSDKNKKRLFSDIANFER